MPRARWIARAVAVATALTVAATGAVTQSASAALDDDVLPFYEAPAQLPSDDGDVIRHEPMSYLLDPLGTSDVAFTSQKMLYRSTDRTGQPHAVSGSVIVPKAPWVGPGERPVIGYAVGTQGVDDRCAPTRQFEDGFEYEGIFMAGLLARGYALAITDYEGLGTAGMHTYMDRVSQGRAVLDAVRAAQRLPGAGLDASSPVALLGYSQGGGAAASATELAGSYAPELDVKGSVVGAVPADLSVLPDTLDGGLYAEFLWYAILGLSASYELDLTPYVNDAGREFLGSVSNDCVFDLATSAFRQSSNYTVDGRSLAELSDEEPFRSILDEQRIGRISHRVPVMVTHSLLDDVIPYAVGRQLAEDWCDNGARVKLSTNATPLHVGGAFNNAVETYSYLEARFAGLRAASSCWRL